LNVEDCLTIVKKASDILKKEPNILALNEPVTVVGDIHGQFYDFLKILDVGGDISSIR
jgi:serine/threonine-protein phosphatase 2B catalytic subunit